MGQSNYEINLLEELKVNNRKDNVYFNKSYEYVRLLFNRKASETTMINEKLIDQQFIYQFSFAPPCLS